MPLMWEWKRLGRRLQWGAVMVAALGITCAVNSEARGAEGLRAGVVAEAPAATVRIPETHARALDGHAVDLPAQMPGKATVLIVGFGRHSSGATTAWEKPVRTQLAHVPVVGFYDMAMIAEVPTFMRNMVVRMIRHEVPEVLRPNFLPLTNDEDAWKQVAGYAADQPDAAYVLVVDGAGKVRWSTHAAYTDEGFAALGTAVKKVAGE